MARNRLTSEDWDANFHQPNGTFGALVRPGRLNPIGRHCIRTPRLQSGMTLDTEIGVCPFGGRKSSRSPALVAVMQSTDLWERDDLAYSG